MKSYQKQKNFRSKKLIDFTKRQPCIIGKRYGDYRPAGFAHHVKLLDGGGTGIKPPDTHIVPLSESCHREIHNTGEKTFEIYRGIDLKKEIVNNLTEYIKGG